MAVKRIAALLGALVVAMGGAAGCGSSSTKPTASPTKARISSSTASGALKYRASYAHFSAAFPSTPRTRTVPSSLAGFQLRIAVAAADSPDGSVEVAEEDISPALPSDQVAPALVAALKGVTTTSDLSISAPPATTSYRSFTAYGASYSQGSRTLRGISLVTDGNARLFILLAPSDLFSALESSFQTTG